MSYKIDILKDEHDKVVGADVLHPNGGKLLLNADGKVIGRSSPARTKIFFSPVDFNEMLHQGRMAIEREKSTTPRQPVSDNRQLHLFD